MNIRECCNKYASCVIRGPAAVMAYARLDNGHWCEIQDGRLSDVEILPRDFVQVIESLQRVARIEFSDHSAV